MKDVWSLSYAERCLQSIQDTESDIEATLFDATTPETIFPVAWTWPTGKKITCSKTNLLLTPYKTYDNNKHNSKIFIIKRMETIKKKMTVGIVGNGFVGESQIFAFKPTNEIRVYDIDPLKSTHTKDETYKVSSHDLTR